MWLAAIFWLIFKIDYIINLTRNPDFLDGPFIGLRGILERISSVFAYLPVTLFVLPLLALAFVLLLLFDLIRACKTKT